ncbi:DUF423 domain-containing protein [Micromonospora sp. PLK6-60]|uniref:DUF423 domain-containing protein n=1 Tax=Micromonospora sp. PLK6-60 TaxID=2873383 RepID=UPI0021048881|nr:DUF423 domain-containing protein [Micromonospora sp. PLK6-60]
MTTGVRRQADTRGDTRLPRWSRPGSPAGPLTLAVLLAAVAYRVVLVLADNPPTNSDEATMGLAALHIAQGRDFPVWFYGQAYMGTLEAYLAAPVVAVFGPSTVALRVPTLALYALFLALAWRLTRRLGGDPWFALLVVGLLALGSDRVLKNQLIAGGGYPELNPAGAALALLTLGLCAADRRARLPGRALWRWAGWGVLAGLMLWVDPLLLPYLVALGAVLLVWRRRELAGRAGMVLVGAVLLGAAPMLMDSVVHGRNPLTAVLAAGGGGATAGWADRLYGGLVLGPPLSAGFCSPGHCAWWQLWWAAALPLLLLLGAAAAVRRLRVPAPPVAPPAPVPAAPAPVPAPPAPVPDAPDLGNLLFEANGNSPRFTSGGPQSDGPAQDERGIGEPAGDERVGAAVRLALLAGAAGLLAAYAVSGAAGRSPTESARYLSCLAVASPALLWPLWTAARRAAPGRWAGVARGAAVAVLAAMLATGGYATWAALARAPEVRAEAQRHRALVDTLHELGVRHVRAGYWTCNRLVFATAERVVCAVVDDRLRPGHDRFPAYRRAVDAAPDAAWVAPAGSPLAARLDQRLDPGDLRLVPVAGWRIYLPRH